MNLFEKLGLSTELLTAIKKLGFDKPTEIQGISIPYIIDGKDVVGESATGSGKTLAFGCGIVERCKPNEGIQALILTPTRELALQVSDSLHKFSHLKRLKVVTVYGGVSINEQINELSDAEVVVATPGRLLDHLSRDSIDISNVHLLVLDEADRMFDMGFIEDVEKIIQAIPQNRQTLFFSATISDRILNLAERHMKDPKIVTATKMVDPRKLKQVYYTVPKNMRLSLLIHLLENEESGLVMVFCNTRSTTDFVVKNLRTNKIDATAIHGGLSQNKRTNTIKMFNTAKVQVLVCTDVAARGLHIDNVSHVYNYEIPKDPTDYVHRIGRTARAGENGNVINLLCDMDFDSFGRILHEYGEDLVQKVETPQVKKIFTVRVDDRDGRNRGGFGRGPRGRDGSSNRDRDDSRTDGSRSAEVRSRTGSRYGDQSNFRSSNPSSRRRSSGNFRSNDSRSRGRSSFRGSGNSAHAGSQSGGRGTPFNRG